MANMAPKFIMKEWFPLTLLIILLSGYSIILNIPFLRQILGFVFLTILPGLLILKILRLDKIDFTEKIVLSVGLSISFLMFFGLLVNNLSLSLGYLTPFSTITILVALTLALITLAIIGQKIDNKNSIVLFQNLNLSTPEKAFLIVPSFFPILSVFGTHLIKTTENNIVLMLLLFLIPAYVIFICFFNRKFSKRLYPVVIFLISISLLLIFMLRFPHICGHDVHEEYGIFFLTTLGNLHWRIIGTSTLDSCLSISILPTIYQSILNINSQEYLFKGVYVSMCSFGPLAVYIFSKKYLDELYAFLASFFFISQSTFLVTAGNPRTNVAIFFVALAVMVFFNDRIDPMKRKLLFIVFIFSMVVSHYSTTYIFFFVILFSWFMVEIFSNFMCPLARNGDLSTHFSLVGMFRARRNTFSPLSHTGPTISSRLVSLLGPVESFLKAKSTTQKKNLSLTMVLIFFTLIFFWYSQLTETAFDAGVDFIGETLGNLNRFFLDESRSSELGQLAGQELEYPILGRVNLAFIWGTFILTGIGVLTMLKRYKEMIILPDIKLKKPDFLKTKFEIEYPAMVFVCSGLLVAMVALPFVSVGYGLQRLYTLVLVLLSVCFIIGGITLAEHSKIKPYLIILLILIPYFMFITGTIYQICGAPVEYTLNSGGKDYDKEYLHDQECFASRWFNEHAEENSPINATDYYGARKLISQGKITVERATYSYFFDHLDIRGYLYLSYNNVVNGKFARKGISYNMSEYSDTFIDKNKIYNNGGSEIWN